MYAGRMVRAKKQPESLRVLGRLRLSRATEESAGSTSIERQREIVEQWAAANGHTVVGWAVDDGVSGSVDPFETPALGPWLNEQHDEWDVLCAWKLDRFGRDSIKLNKLFGFCLEHDKALVSCSEGIDLSSPIGRLIANVVAFLAEGELEAIRERQQASRQKLRSLARWPGGRPPYGYVQARSGDGWVLEVDGPAAEVVQRIVADVIAGIPLHAVATALNSEGVLAPSEHYRQQTGKPVGTSKWRQAPIKLMLQSKAVLGFVHYKGEAVRDDSGAPLRMAEGLISLEDYNRVQTALDRTAARYTSRQREASPLSGLLVCYFCGKGLTYTGNTKDGKVYGYYRHPVSSDCEHQGLIPLDTVQATLEDAFLFSIGDDPIKERVWQPGDSREAELQGALQAFDDLTAAAGTLTSQTARARMQVQLASLDKQIAELEAAPRQEGGWRWIDVGGTYRDAWINADVDGRRELLRRSGITMAVGIKIEGRRTAFNDGAWYSEIRIPDGLMQPGTVKRYAKAAKAKRIKLGIPD